jgi:RNA polymerase sigma-70 factor, ECF subfamily
MLDAPDFTALVDAHYAALYRFALGLTRREADACDLVQQTFYIWATKGAALREQARAKSWLFTTLYHEFLRIRRRGRRMESVEDLPPAEADVADDRALEEFARMDHAQIVSALGELDEVFRVPLTLFYLEAFSYLEIAGLIDVPVGTVMSRLSRGRLQLRAQLSRRLTAADRKVIPFSPGKKGGDR